MKDATLEKIRFVLAMAGVALPPLLVVLLGAMVVW